MDDNNTEDLCDKLLMLFVTTKQLPDFALLCRVHKCAGRALEHGREFGHVGQRPDDPVAGWRVRVIKNLQVKGLFCA